MAKVLAVIGHPRREGSCILLLDRVLEELSKTGIDIERVQLGDVDIQPCEAHHVCSLGKGCVIRDAMWSLYPRIAECDGLIVATPVFFHGLPSGLKAFVDRCQPFWEDRFRAKRNRLSIRPGMLILTAGSEKRSGFEPVRECLGCWCESIAVQPEHRLEVSGLDRGRPVDARPEVLDEAQSLASRFAEAVERPRVPGQTVSPWWRG